MKANENSIRGCVDLQVGRTRIGREGDPTLSSGAKAEQAVMGPTGVRSLNRTGLPRATWFSFAAMAARPASICNWGRSEGHRRL